MATFSDIQGAVRFRLGARTDLSSGDGLTALNLWINAAQQELAHMLRFPGIERNDTSMVTSSADRFVNLPSDAYAVLSVYDSTHSFMLDPFEGGWHEYERQVSTTTTTQPTKWLHFENRIYFKDPPSGAFNLRVGLWINPPTLVNPGDTPVLPPIWHEAITLLATRSGWRALGDDRRADLLEQGEFASFLARVQTPKAVESHVPKRRGLRVRRFITKPHLGI